ncbi:MAG: class I SAM-dependent methyltransferase [Verrucomicrobiales bacterium]|nr:class I SAM-dependent methyltransferase [Verrucomicrobiales bacterium]
MSLLEKLFAVGPIRKAIWRGWYPFLTRRLRDQDVTFLNYAFETDPPSNLKLDSEDEVNRGCIQLYDFVGSGADLRGREVLEVSCGHGGGASWLCRRYHPASYCGLDLNPAGIRFCRERHRLPNLCFEQGDAQRLPFPDAAFDAVINVEASHCYPDFAAFLEEVRRVLRPGGCFLYADFRFREDWSAWEAAIEACKLNLLTTRDISQDVLRGMNRNAARSDALVRDCLPSFLQSLGRDFAGVPGGRVHEALQNGDLRYQAWHLARG